MTNHFKDGASAQNKTVHVSALALIVAGLGVLAYVITNIFLQQRFSASESSDTICQKPAVLVIDATANYSCEFPIATPTSIVSDTPTATASQSPSPTVSSLIPAKPNVLLRPDANLDYAQYSKSPKVESKIGTLKFKELNKSMPMVEGTEKSSLKLGAGHFIGSVLPGVKDNTVIAGHRETVFKSLGKLKIGHRVIAVTSAGTFTYQVTGTRIVDADDRTVIVPTDEAILTLITCYPFEAYGPKPQRYIVSAQLINSVLNKI